MEKKQILFLLSIAFSNFLCQSSEVDPKKDISDVRIILSPSTMRSNFLNLAKEYQNESSQEGKSKILERIRKLAADVKGISNLNSLCNEITRWISRMENKAHSPLPVLPVSPKAEAQEE